MNKELIYKKEVVITVEDMVAKKTDEQLLDLLQEIHDRVDNWDFTLKHIKRVSKGCKQDLDDEEILKLLQ